MERCGLILVAGESGIEVYKRANNKLINLFDARDAQTRACKRFDISSSKPLRIVNLFTPQKIKPHQAFSFH